MSSEIIGSFLMPTTCQQDLLVKDVINPSVQVVVETASVAKPSISSITVVDATRKE
jgi:glycosylphosphatidylinositol transamidase (GPIT) subunit GPI8